MKLLITQKQALDISFGADSKLVEALFKRIPPEEIMGMVEEMALLQDISTKVASAIVCGDGRSINLQGVRATILKGLGDGLSVMGGGEYGDEIEKLIDAEIDKIAELTRDAGFNIPVEVEIPDDLARKYFLIPAL